VSPIDGALRLIFGIRSSAVGASVAFLVLAVAGQWAAPARSAAQPLPPQIHTVAGGGTCSGAVTSLGPCDGVPATSVPIEGARSVAALPDGGYLYIDSGNDLVREVSASGVVTTVAGTSIPVSGGQPGATVPDQTDVDGVPATSSGLDDPVAVAPLPDGGFLITEDLGARVRMVSPGLPGQATITTIAGAAPFTPPSGSAPGAGNNSDGYNGVPGVNGAPVSGTSIDLNFPSDAVPTANGGVLIADSGNCRVLLLSSDGTIQQIAGGSSAGSTGCQDNTGCNDATTVCDGSPAGQVNLDEPDSVSEVPGGNGAYMVSEHLDDSVREVSQESPGGTFTTVAGVPGSPGYSGDGGAATSAQLDQPYQVVALSGGGFLIADTGNQAVRQVSPSGVISTIAGNGTIGYTGDGGAATAAQLNGPTAVAPTLQNGILIADDNNSAIREITQPSVSTITFSPLTPNGANGWYTIDPTVFVSATQNATSISCVLDPAQAPPAFAAIAPGCAYTGDGGTVSGDGTHTIYVASENSFGDQENPISATIKVDTAKPKITCAKKEPVFSLHKKNAKVTATLTDSVSGPASQTLSARAGTGELYAEKANVKGTNFAGVSTSVQCPYFIRAVSLSPQPDGKSSLRAVGSVGAGSGSAGAQAAVAKTAVITSMVVTRVPGGANVSVDCTGKGCPFTRWRKVRLPRSRGAHPPKVRVVKLTRMFARATLPYGTRVVVAVTAPQTIGRYLRFTIGSGKRAALTTGCLAPGVRTPGTKPCSPKIP